MGRLKTSMGGVERGGEMEVGEGGGAGFVGKGRVGERMGQGRWRTPMIVSGRGRVGDRRNGSGLGEEGQDWLRLRVGTEVTGGRLVEDRGVVRYRSGLGI